MSEASAAGQAAFWSKVAQKYDEVVDLQLGGRARAMILERVAGEGRLGHLVEFGCGTGFFTDALAGRADIVLATDLSPGMLDIARRRVRASNVRFQVEDCQKSSLRENSFDTAFLSLVIHFTDPERTLAEMRRVLKPGGTLVIANLDAQSLRGLDRLRSRIRVPYYGITRYRIKPPKHFANSVASERLAGLLAAGGFRMSGSMSIRDPSRSSSIPVDYLRAVKLG